MKENIDFSFVNPMLRKQYCENFGCPAKEPEMMFKLMFLKKIYDLSDEKLIRSAQTDMAYKYFLDLDPEAKMIDPSLLTKFRKTRITEDILEEMLRETVRQAIEKGVIKSTAIIVDSTHTIANARAKTVTQTLRELSKQLRWKIYCEMFELSEKFPDKQGETAELAEEMEDTYKLLETVEKDIQQSKRMVSLRFTNISKNCWIQTYVFNHVINKSVKGFKMLTVGWTDGFRFIPAGFNMMTSAKAEKRVTEVKRSIYKRSNGSKSGKKISLNAAQREPS